MRDGVSLTFGIVGPRGTKKKKLIAAKVMARLGVRFFEI
jgi:hypothetical protein